MAIQSADDFILMSSRIAIKDSCNCWEKQYSMTKVFIFSRHLSEFKWADKKRLVCIFVFPSKLTLELAFVACITVFCLISDFSLFW